MTHRDMCVRYLIVLKEFIESKNEDKFLEWKSKIKYSDEKMQQYIKKVLKNIDIYDIMQLDKGKRNKLLAKIMKIEGMGIRQLSRITGVPISIIRYL